MAMRLRTLPLATAAIALGILLAYPICGINVPIMLLTWLTAVGLQILSNISNDYGDSIHGADSGARRGPQRAVQAGLITAEEMKAAMWLLAGLVLGAGIILVFMAFGETSTRVFFLAIGILSIGAAINYTVGAKPYGYMGLADLAVLVFFGLVAVMGSYYLQCQKIHFALVLPAVTAGCLSIAVLNINNIRDIASDAQAGKKSIPVRIGRSAAVRYHGLLLTLAIATAAIFVLMDYRHPWQGLFLIPTPLLIKNFTAVKNIQDAQTLDPYLKQLALSASLLMILLGLGHVFSF